MPDYSKTRIQFRRGTAAELAANPVLGQVNQHLQIQTV